jgi:uncharacterized linocin/CFP29 family protein
MNTPLATDDQGASRPCPDVPWSQAQWERVRQVVAAEAQKSRVAASFLPLYGPLSGDSDFVRQGLIGTSPSPFASAGGAGAKERLKIEDTSTIRLWTLQVNLYLRGPQLADPELTSVLALFRRAANVLARLEDTVIFNGIPKLSHSTTDNATKDNATKQLDTLPAIWEILGRSEIDDPAYQMIGLLPDSPKRMVGYDASADRDATDASNVSNLGLRTWVQVSSNGKDSMLGHELVGSISAAIGTLEANGHYGPFALVLGQKLFKALQTPDENSLVLPQDRVIPFLGSGGTLLRSTTLPSDHGVLVALGGEPIDLVIAKDISVDFLQVTPDPAYVFRLHEKLVLRIMSPGAICGFRHYPDPPSKQAGPSSPKAPVNRSSGSK